MQQQRLTNASGTSLFDVVVSHEGPSSDFGFTISVFSNDKIKIEDGPVPLPFTSTVRLFVFPRFFGT
jgi:hypothetical protein